MDEPFDNPLLPVPQQEPSLEDSGYTPYNPSEDLPTGSAKQDLEKNQLSPPPSSTNKGIQYYIDCITEALDDILDQSKATQARTALERLVSVPSSKLKEKEETSSPQPQKSTRSHVRASKRPPPG